MVGHQEGASAEETVEQVPLEQLPDAPIETSGVGDQASGTPTAGGEQSSASVSGQGDTSASGTPAGSGDMPAPSPDEASLSDRPSIPEGAPAVDQGGLPSAAAVGVGPGNSPFTGGALTPTDAPSGGSGDPTSANDPLAPKDAPVSDQDPGPGAGGTLGLAGLGLDPQALASSLAPGILLASSDTADFLRKMKEQFRQQHLADTQYELLNLMGDPAGNELKIKALVIWLQGDVAPVVGSLQRQGLEAVAGSPKGVDELQLMKAQLPPVSLEAKDIDQALDVRGSSPTSAIVVKPVKDPAKGRDDQAAIDRINRLLQSDPHMTDYTGAKTPLKFPVEMYSPGRQIDGGVYYNPDLQPPTQARTGGTVFRFSIQKRQTRAEYPLAYMQIGPGALAGSDGLVQAVAWHEFQHYKRWLDFRAPDDSKSAETKSLQSAYEADPSGDEPNQETEAYTSELEYMDSLSDAEVTSILLKLAENLPPAFSTKDAGIARVVALTKGQAPRRQRLLSLIDAIKSKATKKRLAELRTAVDKG